MFVCYVLDVLFKKAITMYQGFISKVVVTITNNILSYFDIMNNRLIKNSTIVLS